VALSRGKKRSHHHGRRNTASRTCRSHHQGDWRDCRSSDLQNKGLGRECLSRRVARCIAQSPGRPFRRDIGFARQADGTYLAYISEYDGIPFEALGWITAMPRASRVEWDAAAQEWFARDAVTNAIVARGRSRAAVLRQEHAHYVDIVCRGAISSDSGAKPVASIMV